jgi:hypothetical protein
VHYLECIRRLHDRLSPRTYIEIGIRNGDSLALSRSRSIGIDPAFEINQELVGPVSLFRQTSDAYFSSLGNARPFPDAPTDLAFIDGMHLFDYALRDFAHIERHAAWSTVVIFDDVLPHNTDMAARDRHTDAWTGDIFKVPSALAEVRPDLTMVLVDTEPTGLLMVLNLDPDSTVLNDRSDEIVERFVRPDPQVVPAEVTERLRALDPEVVLGWPGWDAIREGRGVLSAPEGARVIASALTALPTERPLPG